MPKHTQVTFERSETQETHAGNRLHLMRFEQQRARKDSIRGWNVHFPGQYALV